VLDHKYSNQSGEHEQFELIWRSSFALPGDSGLKRDRTIENKIAENSTY